MLKKPWGVIPTPLSLSSFRKGQSVIEMGFFIAEFERAAKIKKIAVYRSSLVL